MPGKHMTILVLLAILVHVPVLAEEDVTEEKVEAGAKVEEVVEAKAEGKVVAEEEATEEKVEETAQAKAEQEVVAEAGQKAETKAETEVEAKAVEKTEHVDKSKAETGEKADPQDDKRMAELRDIFERALLKAGVSISGAFASELMISKIRGEASREDLPQVEDLAYTSVDLDFRARPSPMAQGRVVLRFEGDWLSTWDHGRFGVVTRWLSLDGEVGELVAYNVGEFRKRYSPLTLHAPELDILYEPALFNDDRLSAMDEEFLGNNDRLLQGISLDIDAAMGVERTGEFHLNLLGARIRSESIPSAKYMITPLEAADKTKYLVGGNMDAGGIADFASVGWSLLWLFDKKTTASRIVQVPQHVDKPDKNYVENWFNGSEGQEEFAQRTSILGLRAGLDLSELAGGNQWTLGMNGEVAMSLEKPANDFDSVQVGFDAAWSGEEFERERVIGSAGLGNLNVGFRPSSDFAIDFNMSVLRNCPDFRNELAQSPNFVGQRIMNVVNDSAWSYRKNQNDLIMVGCEIDLDTLVERGGFPNIHNTDQYSTFDAVYRHVFRFQPQHRVEAVGDMINFQWPPFTKNSYTAGIFTQRELANIAEYSMDTSLQLIMPLGPATPNRIGTKGDLKIHFMDERIEGRILGAYLKEIEPSLAGYPRTTFMRMGGGVKVEVGQFLRNWRYPITASVSGIRSQAKTDGLPAGSRWYGGVISDFYNAGLYFQFSKRFAFLLGGQQIDNKFLDGPTELSITQRHAGVALRFRIRAGSHITARVVDIIVTNHADESKNFDQLQLGASMVVGF